MDNINKKTCSFFGHRHIEYSEEFMQSIESTVDELLKKGVTSFYFGGFGDFDDYCHKAVTKARQNNLQIKRIYCLQDEILTNPKKRPKFLSDENYESFEYFPPEFEYWYKRIYYRNIEIIKRSDFSIFYIRNTENSGAYKALSYARRSKTTIIEL